MNGEPPQTGEHPHTPPTTGSHPPVVQPIEERVEGIRAWLAQLDRKVGTRTYAGAAALILALAGAAVALVLVLQLQDDSAKGEDLQRLREQIAQAEDSASEAAKEDVEDVAEQISELEDTLSSISSGQNSTEERLGVIEDDIEDLRRQIESLETGGVGETSTTQGTGGGTNND